MECSSGGLLSLQRLFLSQLFPIRAKLNIVELHPIVFFGRLSRICLEHELRLPDYNSSQCSSPSPSSPFSSRSTALDAALEFQRQFVVPGTWKTEVKEESSSSEDDDEDEDEEQEEDANGEEEEVEASSTQPPSSGNVCKRSGSLSAGGSGTFPRGAGELSAATLQVHGRQR